MRRQKNKLSKERRERLSTRDFAVPETKSFPIQSKKQAVHALVFAEWPRNKPMRNRVREAVFERYPELEPSSRERRRGKVVKPKKERKAARKANLRFPIGSYVYVTGELEAAEVLGSAPGGYRLRFIDGTINNISANKIKAAHIERRANKSNNKETAQRKCASAFQRKGYTVTQGLGNYYVYAGQKKPGNAMERYKIAVNGLWRQKKTAKGWHSVGKAISLKDATRRLN